jgi:hypothetical protein
VNKRQEPAETKQSPHHAHPPQPSPDELNSAREWEAETPEAPAALELESEELPENDEETKVVLLPVNPYLVHVYWGIAANDREEIGRVVRRLGGRAQPVLRFYDINHVDSDGTGTPGWFEIEIDLRARNWYVHLQSPAKSYCIDLGLRTEGSGFRRLARSNVAETPPAWPSDKVEEGYLLVEGDFPRVATVVPPVQHTGVAKTLPEPPWFGELYRGEEFRPQPKKPRTLSRSVKPAGVVRTFREPPSRAERRLGKGKGPEFKKQRFFRTVAPKKMEGILAELYGRRMREWSGLASKARGAGNPQPIGKKRVDLTELSERSYRKGLSLGRKTS